MKINGNNLDKKRNSPCFPFQYVYHVEHKDHFYKLAKYVVEGGELKVIL